MRRNFGVIQHKPTIELHIQDQFELGDRYIVVVKPPQNLDVRTNWEGERKVLIKKAETQQEVVGKFFLERVSTTIGERDAIYAIAFLMHPNYGNIEKIEFLKNWKNLHG
jgi:hypothetical protein